MLLLPAAATAMDPVPPIGTCGIGEDHHDDGWGHVSVACPAGAAEGEPVAVLVDEAGSVSSLAAAASWHVVPAPGGGGAGGQASATFRMSSIHSPHSQLSFTALIHSSHSQEFTASAAAPCWGGGGLRELPPSEMVHGARLMGRLFSAWAMTNARALLSVLDL